MTWESDASRPAAPPADAPRSLFDRFRDLQVFINWTRDDEDRVRLAGTLLRPHLAALVDDFYSAIDRTPVLSAIIAAGGAAQQTRLRAALRGWLEELLSGHYDESNVLKRSQIGHRHVQIGLDQVYTTLAISRLRSGLLDYLRACWTGSADDLALTSRSLNRLLDLDLALIEDAYQTEYASRQQRIDRLAAIGQVAGGVAHELRNPLNVIKTSAYYLLNVPNVSPEKSHEHLRRIERQVEIADGVITALADFAKLPFPDLQPTPIGVCIEKALSEETLPPTIAVRVECQPDLPRVLVDERQFRIVLGNLIRNARDAMQSGGTLTIAALLANGRVELSVTDTGVGISPEDLGRIMEPLFTTKARGIGLGLALSRAIVEKSRGRIRAASTLGRGSTFTVELTPEN